MGPQTPLDDIYKLCEFLAISVDHFFELAETFRNPNVWSRSEDRWVIEGFLVDDWNWDEDSTERAAA